MKNIHIISLNTKTLMVVFSQTPILTVIAELRGTFSPLYLSLYLYIISYIHVLLTRLSKVKLKNPNRSLYIYNC
jgi:hypothetical protein